MINETLVLVVVLKQIPVHSNVIRFSGLEKIELLIAVLVDVYEDDL